MAGASAQNASNDGKERIQRIVVDIKARHQIRKPSLLGHIDQHVIAALRRKLLHVVGTCFHFIRMLFHWLYLSDKKIDLPEMNFHWL